jgi:hypothetical protein
VPGELDPVLGARDRRAVQRVGEREDGEVETDGGGGVGTVRAHLHADRVVVADHAGRVAVLALEHRPAAAAVRLEAGHEQPLQEQQRSCQGCKEGPVGTAGPDHDRVLHDS